MQRRRHSSKREKTVRVCVRGIFAHVGSSSKRESAWPVELRWNADTLLEPASTALHAPIHEEDKQVPLAREKWSSTVCVSAMAVSELLSGCHRFFSSQVHSY